MSTTDDPILQAIYRRRATRAFTPALVSRAPTALGLATCPIGFAVAALADPRIRAALGLPEGVTPVAPIIVGVPAAAPPAQVRREPEIVCWRD